jgi:DNA polymerase-1
MILQVHDKLVLKVPEEEADATAALVKEVMEGAYPFDAPLRVDVSMGCTWGEAK